MIPLHSATGDAVGIVLFAAALLVPFVSRRNSLYASELLLVTGGSVVRIVLCLLSANEIFLSPALDSLSFHAQALDFANGTFEADLSQPGVQVFTGTIAVFYAMFGGSILLADALGVVAVSLASLALVRLGRLLWPGSTMTVPLAVFLFSPAMLLYANFNYREPFQILFLICAMSQGIRYRRTANMLHLLGMAVLLSLFAVIHGRFLVVVPLILLLTVLYPSRELGGQGLRFLPGLAIGVGLAGGAYLWMSASLSNNLVAQAVTSGNLGSFLEEFGAIASGVGGRTAMPFFPKGGAVDLLSLSPLLLFQYTFAPIIPWIVSEAQDLVALSDTLLRIVTLTASLAILFRLDKQRRNEAWFLLLLYVAFSAVAALGTWTVGTAMRHQIKMSWVLILLSAPVLTSWVRAIVPQRQRPYGSSSRAY